MTAKSKTNYYKVDPLAPDPKIIEKCGHILKSGGLVGFPTETVYGLGANSLDGKACKRIFDAKGRPQDNPLIVHVASPGDLGFLSKALPSLAHKCMEVFWPGPLTLVVPKSAQVPVEVSAGLDTVGIRMPDHPVALALIRAAGVPVAAPSANLSGRPSPTSGEHVMEDLSGKIEAVLDAGPSRVGIESTVLDLTGGIPVILRPGGVTKEQLEEVLGTVSLDPGIDDKNVTPRSPGVKYLHYAPKGRVILVEGPRDKVQARIKQELEKGQQQGLKVGILSSDESASYFSSLSPDYLAVLGSRMQPWIVASTLYQALRECDHKGIELILTETFEHSGMGAAVMNRLEKAADDYRIIEN